MSASPLGWQVILRLTDDRILTPSVASRRAFSTSVLRIGAPFELLFFCAAGTHAHFAVICSRHDAGRFARNLMVSLRRVLSYPVPFERVRRTPIRDQRL